jgi:hypothetical protein
MVSARETGLKWQAAVQTLGACTDLRAAKPAAIWIVRWFAQHPSVQLELPCAPSTAGCKKKKSNGFKAMSKASSADAWLVLQRLFKVFDKDKDGQLNLDELVVSTHKMLGFMRLHSDRPLSLTTSPLPQTYVAEVKKMGLVEVDESKIVSELMKKDADRISFVEFKLWTQSAAEKEQESKQAEVFTDPFGNTNVLPERFAPTTVFKYNKKAEHPCFTTTYNEIGKAPGEMEMPNKWRGKKGDFTTDFVVIEPGQGLTISTYRDRGLRTAKTRSNVHPSLDIDF